MDLRQAAVRARRWARWLTPGELSRRLAIASPRDCLTIKRLMEQRHALPTGDPISVRVKPLGGQEIPLRPGTADAMVLWDTFLGQYHLPPPEIGDIRTIWDLGSNIGLTVAHYASVYPSARIYGIEMDKETARIAQRILKPWGARCSLIAGAVWHEDGQVEYSVTPGKEHGARIGGVGAEKRSVAALSLNTLMAADDIVDFVKCDIEGAEREVLSRNTAWAAKVRSMKVEVHGGYTVEDCAADLQALGFTTRRDTRHWASVVAVRL